jgi:hypothetical protein
MYCRKRPERGKLESMNERRFHHRRRFSIVCGLLLFCTAPRRLLGEPTAQAIAAFNARITSVEARLAQQHRSPTAFLAAAGSAPDADLRLRRGEVVIEQLNPSNGAELPGALLHHWRGTAFAPNAKAADLERLLRDFDAYPQSFAPQVLQARVLAEHDDRFEAWMRVRQKHVLTVVMDSTYDVTFGRLDAKDGFSASRSTQIYEIDAPGTDRERALNAGEEHGFLWRLNSYWTYEERDGGLYIQIESVSLSRSIPTGLGWVVGQFVERVPRESLEFTLRSACNAIRK